MAALFFGSHLFPLQYFGKSDKHQGVHNVLEIYQMFIERAKRAFKEIVNCLVMDVSIFITLFQDKQLIKWCK